MRRGWGGAAPAGAAPGPRPRPSGAPPRGSSLVMTCWRTSTVFVNASRLTRRAIAFTSFPGERSRALLERIEQQPGRDLGKEVGGFGRHGLAGRGHGLDLLDRDWRHQEGGIVLPRPQDRKSVV